MVSTRSTPLSSPLRHPHLLLQLLKQQSTPRQRLLPKSKNKEDKELPSFLQYSDKEHEPLSVSPSSRLKLHSRSETTRRSYENGPPAWKLKQHLQDIEEAGGFFWGSRRKPRLEASKHSLTQTRHLQKNLVGAKVAPQQGQLLVPYSYKRVILFSSCLLGCPSAFYSLSSEDKDAIISRG